MLEKLVRHDDLANTYLSFSLENNHYRVKKILPVTVTNNEQILGKEEYGKFISRLDIRLIEICFTDMELVSSCKK